MVVKYYTFLWGSLLTKKDILSLPMPRSREYIVYRRSMSSGRVGGDPSQVSCEEGVSKRVSCTPAAPRQHAQLDLYCWGNLLPLSGLRMADPALEAALEIKLKGNVLFKENNFEEAIKLYSQAIDACPKHRYCWLTVPCNKIASCQCCVKSLLTFLNACQSIT